MGTPENNGWFVVCLMLISNGKLGFGLGIGFGVDMVQGLEMGWDGWMDGLMDE